MENHDRLVRSDQIKIYIAGPMSGHPNLNWNAFDQKEKQLIDEGFDVVNPARMDRDMGLDPKNMGEYDYEEAARRDIDALTGCDAIYLMSGFQFSKGACWERALAKHFGLKRYYEIPRHDHESQNFGPYGRYWEAPIDDQMKFNYSVFPVSIDPMEL
jgi:nucleoside 2-deoxyribosyltransferase